MHKINTTNPGNSLDLIPIWKSQVGIFGVDKWMVYSKSTEVPVTSHSFTRSFQSKRQLGLFNQFHFLISTSCTQIHILTHLSHLPGK